MHFVVDSAAGLPLVGTLKEDHLKIVIIEVRRLSTEKGVLWLTDFWVRAQRIIRIEHRIVLSLAHATVCHVLAILTSLAKLERIWCQHLVLVLMICVVQRVSFQVRK